MGRKNRSYSQVADMIDDGVENFLTRYGPQGTFFADHPDLPYRPIMHVEILNESNFQYMIPPRDGEPRLKGEAEREALYARLLPAACKAAF